MATNFLDQFIAKWLTPPYSYFLLIIVIVIICYFLFKKVNEMRSDKYRNEKIEYVIKELNLNRSFNNFSRKCKNGKLYYNLGKVNINRVMTAKVKMEKNHEFIILKSGGFINNIPLLGRLSKIEFFVIDNNESYIEKTADKDTWIVKPDVYFHLLADVWISSLSGGKLLTEMVYKRIYEHAKEEDLNYIPRIVWYDTGNASRMTESKYEHELQRGDFDKKVERETGVKK